MRHWMRTTLWFLAAWLLLTGAATAIGALRPAPPEPGAFTVEFLSLAIATFGGALVAWLAILRSGGLALLVSQVGVLSLTYSTSLLPEIGAELTHFRLLSYAFLLGALVGAALGSMKREIDRQRANRRAGR